MRTGSLVSEQVRAVAGRYLLVALALLMLLLQAPVYAAGPFVVRVTGPAAEEAAIPLAEVLVRISGRSIFTDGEGDARFEGLPSGRHELRIAHPGFARVERTIEIPAGVRQPLEAPLEPVASLDWGGEVRARTPDLPVTGAVIELRPLVVAASLAGPAEVVTDWEGRFEFVDLPPGRYGLRISAPGFAVLERELEAGSPAGDEAAAFLLEPAVEAAALDVRVVDATNGEPLAEAEVRLSETGASGIIAVGTSDAGGRVHFAGLSVGEANWMDGEGRVAAARRAGTLSATRADHAGATITARIGVEGPVELPLEPLTEQREQEPNDRFEAPQEIRIGAPMRFRIQERGDHDFFRLRLEHGGLLTATIPEGSPLETHLRLYDAEGVEVAGKGVYAGRENRIEHKAGPGTWYLEVSEWGDNAADDQQDLTLTLEIESAADPLEPNDTLAQAAPVALANEVAGRIWPLGDRDLFRFEVRRPGVLRVVEPGADWERHLRLLDAEGALIGERGVYASRPLSLEHQLATGVYHLEMLEWGGNNASLTPYRLRMHWLPDDGVDDPEATARAARTLPLDGYTGSTLLPTGDADRFSLAIPGAGELTLRSRGRTERHLRLFDREGRLLAEKGVYSNREAALSHYFGEPASAFVEIREWGDNHWSPTAYSLRAEFRPADEQDALGRNDDFDHATPMVVGDTQRGSYLPRGDRDVYMLETDFPGYLRVRLQSPLESHLRIFDEQRRLVAEQGVYSGRTAELRPEVQAGVWYLMAGEWGDNSASPAPYELTAVLERAEPAERAPLAEDPPRRLIDGEAQAFALDQPGDRDRFLFEAAAAGRLQVRFFHPLEVLLRIYDDRSGERLHESGHYAARPVTIPLDLAGPTRLRIEVSEWGDNNASLDAGFIQVDSVERELVAAPVSATVDPGAPTLARFQVAPFAGRPRPEACEVDLDGDGRADLRLRGSHAGEGRFAEPGLYRVAVRCSGPEGQTSLQELWVDARGPRDRAGIALSLSNLSEGMVVERPQPIQAQAASYDGRRIAAVSFSLDGEPLVTDFDPPYLAEPSWMALAPGVHRLKVVARDEGGTEATLERTFTRSEYFDLQPLDGAVVSGETVRISWRSADFGVARIRYRPKGEVWQEVIGESGRQRSVTLSGLEATVPYEWQPLGVGDPGPVRTLTRVKGLAFGSPRYGANIRRDYDQKVGISVRNNGDAPLVVRLECGRPADPLLLVGFVGEGSEDRPFELAPGEERRFQLGISAQDVTTEEHRFPVRIVSDDGLSDEAEVLVHVQLPKVDLAWEDLGDIEGTRGRRYRLRNLGDPVTDLQVTAADPDSVEVVPSVHHGLLRAGGTIEFTVTPRFHEGFTGVETTLVARGLDKAFEQPYRVALAPGERARRVWLLPGMAVDGVGGDESSSERLLIERAERGTELDPASVDWSRRQQGSDRDGDGLPDRWSLTVDDTRWVGDDTDGDQAVDFVHADIGDDGVYEYSAILEEGRWRPTNLVEAWLEMGFALPWSRSSYEAHDADITLNGEVIGRLRDTIPEGNYRFAIPPRLLRFDDAGNPGENRVGIRSEHLRGGHYVVNSDFRFKFRLTSTPVWTVAKSRQEARAFAVGAAGLSVSAPDLSLSSAELRLDGPEAPNAGDEMSAVIPLHNLGAISPAVVEVALMRATADGGREELARVPVERPSLLDATSVKVSFRAPGGKNTLYLVVDPDDASHDSDRGNNEAVFFLEAAGDDQPPVIDRISLRDGATLNRPLTELRFRAQDDQGPATSAVSVDGGLWHELPPGDGETTAPLLLQPGERRIRLRALDQSGNVAEIELRVSVEAAAPEAGIIAPAEGAVIDARAAEVVVEASADSALIAARTAGGPWHKAALVGSQGRVELPLRFGEQEIEVIVADKQGAVTALRRTITCARQPAEGEGLSGRGAADQGLLWPADRPDLEIDLFRQLSGPLTKLDLPAAEQAQRLRDDARRRQAQGDYAGALNKYRESLLLHPDPATEDRVKKLEVYLRVEER